MDNMADIARAKHLRGMTNARMLCRYQQPAEAMIRDWRRIERLRLVCPERTQLFLSEVINFWLLQGELTFAEELSRHVDTSVFALGMAAQEMSFLFCLPRPPGLLRRMVDQIWPRLKGETLDEYRIEYVDKVCLLADAVAKHDDGEWTPQQLYNFFAGFTSVHNKVNFYFYDVVREHRSLFTYEEMLPLYKYLESRFKVQDNCAREFMRSLRKLMRAERKAQKRAE